MSFVLDTVEILGKWIGGLVGCRTVFEDTLIGGYTVANVVLFHVKVLAALVHVRISRGIDRPDVSTLIFTDLGESRPRISAISPESHTASSGAWKDAIYSASLGEVAVIVCFFDLRLSCTCSDK